MTGSLPDRLGVPPYIAHLPAAQMAREAPGRGRPPDRTFRTPVEKKSNTNIKSNVQLVRSTRCKILFFTQIYASLNCLEICITAQSPTINNITETKKIFQEIMTVIRSLSNVGTKQPHNNYKDLV